MITGVTIENAGLLTTRLLSFALLLQAFEMLRISSKKPFAQIWSFENLQRDLCDAIPLPISFLRKVFSVPALQMISGTQMLVAAAAAVTPHWILFTLLFFTHLYTCMRFRGTFNGGSDMMTFVVITGVLVMYTWNLQIGAIYITIHLIYSYIKAGLAKVRHTEWWNGQALPTFLKRSVLSSSHTLAEWLEKNKSVSRILGWTTMLFELAAIPMIFIPSLLFPYFVVATIFHFGVYLLFGLNRFLWIWFAAWPAALFAIPSLLKHG